MNDTQLVALITELVALPAETEWVEFKVDNAKPDEIGEYLSAISNSSALHQREKGYLVWGIDDKTHQVVGTDFKPRQKKVGNEELEHWLSHSVFPSIDFNIHELFYHEKPVVLFEVQPAFSTPVRFKDKEFIRVGSYKKPLRAHPEKERALWKKFSIGAFEKEIAADNLSPQDVLTRIDYPGFFDLLGLALPENRDAILERLIKEKALVEKPGGRYDITNLGAILFAKDLRQFDALARKAVRIIQYKRNNKIETLREATLTNGYAIGFKHLIEYITNLLPQNEAIGLALRREEPMYPPIAIRELVANALIHQDFTLTGTGPMVEIFSDRIEITNPGAPLVAPLRFIDEPPRSRNEVLAGVMRRLNICEERGSGIDKVIYHVESLQLPAPDFQEKPQHLLSILYAYQKLEDMDKKGRIRACHQHACLCYVSNISMTNATLRKRFGIAEKNYPLASRIIADTVKAELIKASDPDSTSKKYARYLPVWA